MKKILRLFFVAALFIYTAGCSLAEDKNVWVNNLRSIFLNNSAIIYGINLRTFNAQDANKNGLIDFDENEESGTFLNAIDRLDELKNRGINTIHLLPITPVGTTKALGTAGSLYAASDFKSLNPQLGSDKTALSIEYQARKFITEAHKRGISVIVDLPSMGSYNLYMTRPELFVKDKSGQPVIPVDWTDTRLLDAGTESEINHNVFMEYKGFVDMVIGLGADGIRADVASCKPAKFWKELIDYSRKKDNQFLWLAEASDSWTKPVHEEAVYTPYDKLLEAGFDGFYGSFFNLKDWKTGKKLTDHLLFIKSLYNKYPDRKTAIGSFSTHDELSPILINGEPFSEMIIWLNATMPINSYAIDGFPTGDNYIYFWANKKADKTFTDDEYYFAHRGKMDIFNFSRRPGGRSMNLSEQYDAANRFKLYMAPVLNNGDIHIFKTSSSSVFAYAISYSKQTVLVVGNLNSRVQQEVEFKLPKFDAESKMLMPLKLINVPHVEKNKFKTTLYPAEIQVYMIEDYEIKK